MHEYTGVIHVHSTYSDGSGAVSEILRTAESSGLDYLILTDHNTRKAGEDGWSGWHGRVLSIVGEEVSARCGHCLAIGTSGQIDHRQPADAIIRDITGQDGLAFIAHPHGVYRPLLKRRDHSWKDWSVHSFTGLELWSYMFDWASRFHYSRFMRHYKDPDAWIRGPFPETLRLWDQLCLTARTVAIGGVDAHARHYAPLPFVVFPYEQLFRTVRTHILTDEPLDGSDGPGDTQRVVHALSQGACFAAWDGLADSTGFRFWAEDGVSMGQEVRFQRPLILHVRLPREADIHVFRDGHPITCSRGKAFSFTANRPGVYRTEARLSRTPWVYSNPIYLRD